MSKYTVEEEQDRTIPEDTIVRARLEDVSEKTIEWTKNGEKKSADILEWWFEVIDKHTQDGLFEGRKVKGSCDAKLTTHPRNKFRNWAEALLGRELPTGVAVDPEADLQGLVADITVSHREYMKNGEKRIIEEIDEVIAIDGMDDDVPF